MGLSLVLTFTLFTTVAVISWLSNLYLQLLEASFIVNISIIANMPYHAEAINLNQLTLASVEIAEFVGIDISLRLKIVEFFRQCVKMTMKKPLNAPVENTIASLGTKRQNTVTIVDLREPLLEDEPV